MSAWRILGNGLLGGLIGLVIIAACVLVVEALT